MTKIEQTVNLMKEENTFKRYQEGDHTYKDFSKQILRVKNFKNLNFCVFHLIWVKFAMGRGGDPLGKEQHRISLE